jgi:exosortase
MPQQKHVATAPTGQRFGSNAGWAVAQTLILIALCVWAFWPEFCFIYRAVSRNSDWAHALAVPLAVLILLHRRRAHLARNLTKGSVWGLALVIGGLAVLAVTTWPFTYGYPRFAAIVLVLAGIVLAVGGWRVLKLCLPMLLLVLLSIPIGPRKYASLITVPERYTLATTRWLLDQLPGVEVEQDGLDFSFTRDGQAGTIALGEPRRGASLLMAYAVIGVFVTFSRLRPVWQIAVLAVATIPIALLCNLARTVTWGPVTIYGGVGPASPVPRAVAAVVSLLLAYGLFSGLIWVLSNLLIEDQRQPVEPEAGHA